MVLAPLADKVQTSRALVISNNKKYVAVVEEVEGCAGQVRHTYTHRQTITDIHTHTHTHTHASDNLQCVPGRGAQDSTDGRHTQTERERESHRARGGTVLLM